MFQNTIYYAGKQPLGEELFLLEFVNNENDFSNYIYVCAKAICKDDKYIITNVEFINNIFNCLYLLNVNNLEKIDGELYKKILYSTFEFLLNDKKNLKVNEEIYNMLINNLELEENNNSKNKNEIFVKKDIYTVNKIKALDLISEMENKKC